MRFYLAAFAIVLSFNLTFAQTSLSAEDSAQIYSILTQQQKDWNNGDIEGFMTAYWPTDQVVFIGADGPTYGWEAVRKNYHRRYPDKSAMGTLQFTVIDLFGVDKSTASLLGNYHLTRDKDNLQGIFSLIWRKFDDQWLIVSDHTTADPTKKRLQDRLTALMESTFADQEPGGALLVAQGDQILYQEGFGVANLESKEKITEHTVFNTGSISKTFVANGILLLAQEERLGLSDQITDYFTFAKPDVVKDITIQHLLSHTSGLPDLRNVSARRDFYLTADDQDNFTPLLSTKRLNFEPGSQFQYSNPAYNGLALIIEQVTGAKWQDFVRTNIFDAANMSTSKITDGPEPRQNVAHAYDRSANKWLENDFGEFPTFCAAGNGGIWSSVVELFYYEQALQKGSFLPQEVVTDSRTPLVFENWSQGDPFVGHGWWRGEKALFGDTTHDKDVIFHTGSQGGFRGYHIYYPEERIFIAGLFNRPVGRDLISEITDIVLAVIP